MADKHITDLISVSRHFGADKAYVIAGGGNTSYKNDRDIWVKASGTTLGDITSRRIRRVAPVDVAGNVYKAIQPGNG